MAMIVTYTHYFSLFMYILPRWSPYVYTQLLFSLKISSERRLLSCVHSECLHQHQCWCSEWISWIPIVLFRQSDTCHDAWKRVPDRQRWCWCSVWISLSTWNCQSGFWLQAILRDLTDQKVYIIVVHIVSQTSVISDDFVLNHLTCDHS